MKTMPVIRSLLMASVLLVVCSCGLPDGVIEQHFSDMIGVWEVESYHHFESYNQYDVEYPVKGKFAGSDADYEYADRLYIKITEEKVYFIHAYDADIPESDRTDFDQDLGAQDGIDVDAYSIDKTFINENGKVEIVLDGVNALTAYRDGKKTTIMQTAMHTYNTVVSTKQFGGEIDAEYGAMPTNKICVDKSMSSVRCEPQEDSDGYSTGYFRVEVKKGILYYFYACTMVDGATIGGEVGKSREFWNDILTLYSDRQMTKALAANSFEDMYRSYYNTVSQYQTYVYTPTEDQYIYIKMEHGEAELDSGGIAELFCGVSTALTEAENVIPLFKIFSQQLFLIVSVKTKYFFGRASAKMLTNTAVKL